MPETRAYRFAIAFEVEPEHPAYDDPEWAADATWGALARRSFVPGKRLLARCRELVTERYGAAMGDSVIISAASEDELMPLIELVRRCEAL